MELKTEHITDPILEVRLSDERIVDALESIRTRPWAIETSVFGTALHVMVKNESQGEKLIKDGLAEIGIKPLHIEKIMPSLEDVFLYLLDREAAGAKAEGRAS
jgi:ABC-2 type transport system ATP-binding protein